MQLISCVASKRAHEVFEVLEPQDEADERFLIMPDPCIAAYGVSGRGTNGMSLNAYLNLKTG